jgi:hypothetical protein
MTGRPKKSRNTIYKNLKTMTTRRASAFRWMRTSGIHGIVQPTARIANRRAGCANRKRMMNSRSGTSRDGRRYSTMTHALSLIETIGICIAGFVGLSAVSLAVRLLIPQIVSIWKENHQ